MADTYKELDGVLNQLAGTDGLSGQDAANVWAATSGKELLEALNVKAGNTTVGSWRGFNGVCNQLASTFNLDGVAALNVLAGNTL